MDIAVLLMLFILTMLRKYVLHIVVICGYHIVSKMETTEVRFSVHTFRKNSFISIETIAMLTSMLY